MPCNRANIINVYGANPHGDEIANHVDNIFNDDGSWLVINENPIFCSVWTYKNADVNLDTRIILCQGKIKFTSLGVETPWHGWYEEFPNRFELHFDYKGRENKAEFKYAVVFRISSDPCYTRYVGYDYLERPIVMTSPANFYWDPEDEEWFD